MRCPPIWCVKMMFDMFDGSLVVKLLFVWSEASSFITLTSLNVTYQQVLECSWYRKDFGESISHQGNPSCRFFVSCFFQRAIWKFVVDSSTEGAGARKASWGPASDDFGRQQRWNTAAYMYIYICICICIYIHIYIILHISTTNHSFALLSRGPHLLGMLQAFLMARYFLECTTISKT